MWKRNNNDYKWGNNWNTTAAGGPFNKIKFTSSSTGYCVGDNSQILKTTNGGVNWYIQISPVNNSFRGCFFTGANTGYIAGGNYQTGVILKTTTGGESFVGIEPASNEIPDKFMLYQNYPNPFNPGTKIKFSIPLSRGVDAEGGRGVSVRLLIYDVLGRELTTLVNEDLSPGSYEVKFDGSNYSSGTYFYKLTSGDYLETKRMMLIK